MNKKKSLIIFFILFFNISFSQDIILESDNKKNEIRKNEINTANSDLINNKMNQDGWFIFRGFIYEKASGEVIPFQKIKIYSTSNEFSVAVTDVNGFFSIPKLKVGTYYVSIESTIYETLKDTILLEASSQILQKKYELIKEIVSKELSVARVNVDAKKKTT